MQARFELSPSLIEASATVDFDDEAYVAALEKLDVSDEGIETSRIVFDNFNLLAPGRFGDYSPETNTTTLYTGRIIGDTRSVAPHIPGSWHDLAYSDPLSTEHNVVLAHESKHLTQGVNPNWLSTEEARLTKRFKMAKDVFGVAFGMGGAGVGELAYHDEKIAAAIGAAIGVSSALAIIGQRKRAMESYHALHERVNEDEAVAFQGSLEAVTSFGKIIDINVKNPRALIPNAHTMNLLRSMRVLDFLQYPEAS